MRDIIYGENGLPADFPGGYVAWLDDEVVMTADTDDELCDRLARSSIDEARVAIGYVHAYDVVSIGGYFRVVAGDEAVTVGESR